MEAERDLARRAAELGLPPGRMVGPSKTDYPRAHRRHLVLYNAVIPEARVERL